MRPLLLRSFQHRMREMRSIAVDDHVAWASSLLGVLPRAHTAELIEVLFEVETYGGQRNVALDGSPDLSNRFDAAFAQLL